MTQNISNETIPSYPNHKKLSDDVIRHIIAESCITGRPKVNIAMEMLEAMNQGEKDPNRGH